MRVCVLVVVGLLCGAAVASPVTKDTALTPESHAQYAFDGDYETSHQPQAVIAGNQQQKYAEQQLNVQAQTAVVLPEVAEDSDNEPAVESLLVQTHGAETDMVAEDPSNPSPSPSPVVPAHLRSEIPMPKHEADSEDGRKDMEPAAHETLDADCDSPQLGEAEANPQSQVVVNMNTVNLRPLLNQTRNGQQAKIQIPEQPPHTRDALAIDDNTYDHEKDTKVDPENIVILNPTEDDESPGPVEMDEKFRTETLPPADVGVAKKSKCSRNLNGHDVPNALDALDDDCGMPEPVIPCETKGNSTLCGERIQLAPPPIPAAELMPPKIPRDRDLEETDPFVDLSIEFVDFGATRQFKHFHESNTVGRAVERIGAEFSVDVWAIHLVRSGGVAVNVSTLIRDLPDKQQLVVYLSCAYKRHQSRLLMKIPICEDLFVQKLVARVEIPAYHELHVVEGLTFETVGALIARAPLPEYEKVTYNGNEVIAATLLKDIKFQNNSAFIVYPKEPCRSWSSTPSASPSPRPSPSPTPSTSAFPSPTPSPLPVKHKVRKLGAYDAYRHCKNARGDKLQAPPPDSLGLDTAAVDPDNKAGNPNFECEGSEMTEPEPLGSDFVNATRPRSNPPPSNYTIRSPMRRPARIMVSFEGRKIPVLIKPIAKGIDIFDAVERATGKPHKYLVAYFQRKLIDHFTPLKPIGFLTGDEVLVVSAEQPADGGPPKIELVE